MDQTTVINPFVGTRFENVPPRDVVEDLIARAGFDAYDADAATSGLCGTFALALYRVALDAGWKPQICVLAAIERDGQPEYGQWHKGDIRHLHWRHVVVQIHERLYDVDGRVNLPDIIENYCWGNWNKGGCLVPLTFVECVRMMRSTAGSYDRRYSAIWKHKLSQARSR